MVARRRLRAAHFQIKMATKVARSKRIEMEMMILRHAEAKAAADSAARQATPVAGSSSTSSSLSSAVRVSSRNTSAAARDRERR